MAELEIFNQPLAALRVGPLIRAPVDLWD